MLFGFWELSKTFKISSENPIGTFLEWPQYYYDKYQGERGLHALIDNAVLEYRYLEGDDFNTFLHYIERKFPVLVLDIIHESLILLKRKLCWTVRDMLQLQMRKTNHERTTKYTNESLSKMYQKFSPLDFAFYRYFKGVLEREIASDETNKFCVNFCKLLQTALSTRQTTIQLQLLLHENITFSASQWEPSFNMTGYNCVLIVIDTTANIHAQRVRQYPQLCEVKDLGLCRGNARTNRRFCGENLMYTYPCDMLF